MEIAIISLGLLFFGGHALQWFFEKTKIPDLLILIVIGYIAGPIMGLVNHEDLGQMGGLIATLALIVILYEAGLHLSTKELKECWLPSLLLSIFTFASIAVVVTSLTTPLVGFPNSLLIAFAVGSTSSAIVIPMVKVLSIQQKTKTILSLESAFTDVFAIVLFLVTLEGIQTGQMDATSVLFNIGPKTVISMGFGGVMAFAWSAMKKYAGQKMQMKFAGEAWALLCYGLAEYIQLNGAMAVLCLGFGLANLNLLPRWITRFFSTVPVNHEDTALLNEITFLLKTFFFLYLGLLVSFSSLKIVSLAAVITLAILLTRFVAIKLLMPQRKNYGLLDTLLSTAMGPRGLACAVLATLPLRGGLVGGMEIQQLLFATIPLTILTTALLVFLCESRARARMQFLFPNHSNSEPQDKTNA